MAERFTKKDTKELGKVQAKVLVHDRLIEMFADKATIEYFTRMHGDVVLEQQVSLTLCSVGNEVVESEHDRMQPGLGDERYVKNMEEFVKWPASRKREKIRLIRIGRRPKEL